MKFKQISPFIYEMLVFLFVVMSVFVGLLSGKFITISIRVHILTISASILVFVPFVSLFSRIISTGSRVLFDFVFQKTKEINCVFLKTEPFKASVFTEKIERNSERSIGLYYLVHVRDGKHIKTLLSSKYIHLNEGNNYLFKTGKTSNVILTVSHSDGSLVS